MFQVKQIKLNIMNTRELLISKLQTELSYQEYVRTSKWWLNHIDRLSSEFGFLKIGTKIEASIYDEVQICEVRGFIINNGMSPSILVETDLGNVYYYDTKKV